MEEKVEQITGDLQAPGSSPGADVDKAEPIQVEWRGKKKFSGPKNHSSMQAVYDSI